MNVYNFLAFVHIRCYRVYIYTVYIYIYILYYIISQHILYRTAYRACDESQLQISDQGFNMRPDIKYAVIYSLYRISVHAT